MKLFYSCVNFTRQSSASLANMKYLILPLFHLQQPQVILLKEGTDSSQGKGQVVSNINACAVLVDAVRTTLGPRGMDKLMVNSKVNELLTLLILY